MSASQKVQQLKAQFALFDDLNFENFFRSPGAYSEWDGFNIQEFQAAVEFIRTTYKAGFEKNVFIRLPVGSLSGLINQISNALQHCQALVQSPGNQGHFQNSAGALDSWMQQTMLYDVPFLIAGGPEVETARKTYEHEAGRLAELSANAEALNKSVKNLIEPAVSGALSKSFSDRRKALFAGRIVWGVLTVATLVGAIAATDYLIEALLHLATPIADVVKGAATVPPSATPSVPKEPSIFPLLALRSAILIPIYIALGFFFSQYRKERDLEEEYAHKTAVATTLPNYGDLAKDDKVKDQIVSGASNVIFASPIKKVQDQEEEVLSIKTVQGLLDSVAKVLPKRN